MASLVRSSRSGKSLPGAGQNVHIMLDLEVARSGRRTLSPAIIEMAAVRFDLLTGQMYEEFKENVNAKSCIDLGLDADKDPKDMTAAERETSISNKDNTILWLKKNIPGTYEKSLSLATSSPLPDVLRRFTEWVQNLSKEFDRENVKIWAKPSVYDFVWLSNAYTACNFQKPWGHWPSFDCITAKYVCYLGTDGPGAEKFHGLKHDALDDCKNQVTTLVKATKFKEASTEPLSGKAMTGLNDLLEFFCISTAQPPGTFEELGCSGPTAMREVNSTLERVEKLMRSLSDNQNLIREEISTETPNKRIKLTLDKKNKHPELEVKGENITSTLRDHGGSPHTSAIPGLTDVDTEEVSDYGDNSELDELFHSFSA